MFDLSQISAYLVPSIVILCLCVGYIIKHVIPSDAANKYIPLIVGATGLVAAIVSTVSAGLPITVDIVVEGLVSGLASTGVQQAFTQLLEKNEDKNDTQNLMSNE